MTNFIYQSKIDNSINNTNTTDAYLASPDNIIGSLNQIDVSESPSITTSNYYLKSSTPANIDILSSPQALCDLLMAAKKIDCGQQVIECPPNQAIVYNPSTGSIGCGCPGNQEIKNPDDLINKITENPDIVNGLKDCNKKIYTNALRDCLGPSFFEELNSLGSPNPDIDKIIKDVTNNLNTNFNSFTPEESSWQLEQLNTAITMGDSETNPNFQGSIDHLSSRIAECKNIVDNNCVVKSWPGPGALKLALQSLSLIKKCEKSDNPIGKEIVEIQSPALNTDTCQCECPAGFTFCASTNSCIKCAEGSQFYEQTNPLGDVRCFCDCDALKQTYTLDSGTKTGCLPICQDGYTFVEVPCDNKASVFQDPANNKCYGCACKKTGTWPFSKPTTATDNCDVENSEPRPDKACECDCKKGTVRYNNPYWGGLFGPPQTEEYRCIFPCPAGYSYSWNHRKCIKNICYNKMNDDNPNNNPVVECYDGKELNDDCVCACPSGTVWNGNACDCPEGKTKVFNPKVGNLPSVNPVYGQDYVCVKCKPNEIYNWSLKLCVPIASGPSNQSNLQNLNVQNLGYPLYNSIEVL
jgi:hypothetical protein